MSTRILIVVTNVDHYDADPSHPTGLWLSELTHAYDIFAGRGFEQTIVSPAGGKSPLEPRSLKFPNYDKSAKAWHEDPARMALLDDTASAEQIDSAGYDAIYFTGGHAVMFDFPGSAGLQRITGEIFERGGVVGAVCHGYCGLLDTTLANGDYLVAGRDLTGFSWREEVLARVDKLVPYNVEERIQERGARYSKALLPFVSNTVVDGRLVTGQNPGSAKETATKVAALL
ncbi:type 1 glutamine amidotransferase domain-containing protein [Micromonospora sp. WMMD1076]|uniref:type 1 glutamine amidotransferase domain-containing protein n=1 Tax=Micromonospora sp. WMMD1076 TaxID=3016103 RepID=UPI00249A4320|nr:type 1 glutamine amidotransferase domain-containing protein [Micromonospora sp. WMMD1076]WFF07819.1 type 1 glutamine amidotransferase domain-containing protein [Micromonospora sp. WMMD1076]